jgi:hypothetical protein
VQAKAHALDAGPDLRFLRALQQKTWKDEDIKEDVDYIVDKMMQYVSELRCVANIAYTRLGQLPMKGCPMPTNRSIA